MGGLILVLALACLALLSMLLIRHRRMQRLSRQAEAFLDGTEMPLPCALSDGSAARLQNALSRLENALLLSREQTKQEAARRREQTLKDAQAACDALRSSARLSEAAAEIVRRVVER